MYAPVLATSTPHGEHISERFIDSPTIREETETSKRPKVLNLSKQRLTQQQIRLLMKGPKFCVTTSGNFFDFKSDTRCFTKRLILQEAFFDQTINDDSLVKNPSKRYMSTKNNDLNEIINTLHKLEPTGLKMKSNIEKSEEKALKELKLLVKTEIEIKKADKSDTWVIMDKILYRDNLVLKEHLLTPTYEKAANDAN